MLLAIYHLSAQVLGRRPKVKSDGSIRPGASAVAAAAYRSGERLKDERAGREQDYTRRGGVRHSEIMLPVGAADWLADRGLLWNTVEAMEKREDAQLCREINIALPFELTHEQRLELVRGYVWEQFVSKGMVADIALHDPDPAKGMSDKNFHAHVMLTLRQATERGLHPVKTREWNSRDLLAAWRGSWEQSCNRALIDAGRKGRIDHRTLVAQRKDAERRGDHIAAARLNRRPEVHVGPKARQAARRGYEFHSSVRDIGPGWHTEPGRAGVVPGRRAVDYRRVDRGTRLNWLEEILVGNNRQLRADLQKLDRQAARMRRKWTFWTRQASFWAEGQVMGAGFRFNRARAAEEARAKKAEAERKRAHAEKRRDQAKGLVEQLERLVTGTRSGWEWGLARKRQVEGWTQARQEDRVRDGGRGRTRER